MIGKAIHHIQILYAAFWVLHFYLEVIQLNSFPGVYGDVEPLRTFPNSVVKRICGKYSGRVTACKSSSMPGLYLIKSLYLLGRGFWFDWEGLIVCAIVNKRKDS